eukprot:12315334-Ditylum_brightwellii.AAC.1
MTEDRTTTSFTINSYTVSSVTYNSAKTEHSMITHKTKEQILELAAKDALYAWNGGNFDIDCNENDLHHNSVIEEDK